MDYLDSNKVSVFPSANRVGYPNSRLTNETNLTGFIRHITGTDKDSFVITQQYTQDGDFEFVLHGYYFKIPCSEISGTVYAHIKTIKYGGDSSIISPYEEIIPYDVPSTVGDSGTNTYSGTLSEGTVSITNVIVGNTGSTDITGTVTVTVDEQSGVSVSTTISETSYAGTSFSYTEDEQKFNVVHSVSISDSSVSLTTLWVAVPQATLLDNNGEFIGLKLDSQESPSQDDNINIYTLQLLDSDVIPEDSRLVLTTNDTHRQVSIDDGMI